MADTTTSNYSLTKPEIGASENTWGTKLNSNMDSIDTQLKANADAAAAAQTSADASLQTSDIGVTVQGYDATLLNSADIGVTVQGYDADIPTVAASQAEMEAGTQTALRSMSPLRVAQAIAALVVPSSFPTGTLMLFQQTTAPTGWTKQTTHNNKALRVVTGTASSGGSVAFTTAFASQAVAGTVGSKTLTTTTMPAHTHSIQITTGTKVANGKGGTHQYTTTTTGSTGGGGSHNHTFTGTAIDLTVQYVDLIIASKD